MTGDSFTLDGQTYYQEWQSCGKVGCECATDFYKRHGPYWYACDALSGERRYIGEQLPPAVQGARAARDALLSSLTASRLRLREIEQALGRLDRGDPLTMADRVAIVSCGFGAALVGGYPPTLQKQAKQLALDLVCGIDLESIDLSKANLSGADLSGIDLRHARLEQADLSRANLSGAVLSGVDLRGADLGWANLSRVDLRWADLSEVNLSGADLREADLKGANLGHANLSQANLSQANLREANLEHAIVSPRQLASAQSLQGTTMSPRSPLITTYRLPW